MSKKARGRRPEAMGRSEAEVRRLAYELRTAGIAERGLGYALRVLGLREVSAVLADGEPFGRSCRRRAWRAQNPERRAAWTVLAACEPAAVGRRLERAGIAGARRRSADRGVRQARGLAVATAPLAGGRASFGSGAASTPFQEQLAAVALVLFEGAAAA